MVVLASDGVTSMQVSNPATASLKGEFMDERNVASLEASKKLYEAGIVLETEVVWARDEIGWYLRSSFEDTEREVLKSYPAPSMTELLREMPNSSVILKNRVYYYSVGSNSAYKKFISENPADALIELLVWLKGEKK